MHTLDSTAQAESLQSAENSCCDFPFHIECDESTRPITEETLKGIQNLAIKETDMLLMCHPTSDIELEFYTNQKD